MKMYNLKPMHKRIIVTHAKGYRLRPDTAEPVKFNADIRGSFKASSAERLLRRETMDVSITVFSVSEETVDYVIDGDAFMSAAKVVKNQER